MERKEFQAESKRLLDLMINSIYTHKEIFLRELISNASDAEDKLAYKALTDDQVPVDRKDLKVTIVPDKEMRTLTVSDNGVGMTKEELENNLGTIAKSGSFQFKQGLAKEEKGEDIDVIGSEKVRTRLVQAETGIRAILENARQGQVLREGVTVAIVGSPNVGKSSLLNALAQEEVAIVTDIPGTTRDRIEHWVSLNGVPVKMVDTAGIRTTDDVVESKGIERTLVEIRKADVVLHLKDASGLIRDDTEVLDKVLKEVRHGVPLITVNNKVDLCESAASGGEIAISAKQGVGLSELKARLLEVVGMAATTDGVFMARERHLQCLKTAAEHVSRALLLIDCDPMPELVAEELRLASRALGEILGETTTEDILGMIFSKFCIGK